MTRSLPWPRAALALLATLAAASVRASDAAEPKYYFHWLGMQVLAQPFWHMRDVAEQLYRGEVGSRREITTGLGAFKDEAALLAALEARKLRGFRVLLSLDAVDVRPKTPDARGRKQVAVNAKVSLMALSVPGNIEVFRADGKGTAEGYVAEVRAEPETRALIKSAMAAAIKRMIDGALEQAARLKAPPPDASSSVAGAKRKR